MLSSVSSRRPPELFVILTSASTLVFWPDWLIGATSLLYEDGKILKGIGTRASKSRVSGGLGLLLGTLGRGMEE